MGYRTVNFRDGILWPLAYELGLDPTKELLIHQAAALTSYINAWVRKSWDSTDWPEWTEILPFAPDTSHRVPLVFLPTGQIISTIISRVFKVYLRDPNLSQGPLDTAFRLLGDLYVHCGFEHGTNIWLKFIANPPQFTSDEWDPGVTYRLAQEAYSPVTGECYISLSNNNLGHDPSLTATQDPLIAPVIPLAVNQTQYYSSGTAAVTGQDEIWRYNIAKNNWYQLTGTIYTFHLADSGGLTHTFSYTTPSAGMTASAVMDGIIAAAGASSDTWPHALTFVKDTVNNFLYFHLATAPFADANSTIMQGTTLAPPDATETQKWVATTAATASIPQTFLVNLNPGTWQSGATYQVKVTDAHGTLHTASYASAVTDSSSDVVNGVLAAMNADPFLQTLPVMADHVNMTLSISSPSQQIAVDAQMQAPDSVYWQYVPFPFALADIVLRGAYADCLKEWGQNEKAAASEQLAATEGASRANSYLGPPFNKLTDQSQPRPKYTVQ